MDPDNCACVLGPRWGACWVWTGRAVARVVGTADCGAAAGYCGFRGGATPEAALHWELNCIHARRK